jgi:3-dehydroquinate dehydratase
MIEQRLPLLHILKQHDNADVVEWAVDMLSRIPDELRTARNREEKLYNEPYLQFE